MIPTPDEIQRWYEHCTEARVWNRTQSGKAVPILPLTHFIRPATNEHQTVPGRMTFTVLERK